MITFKHPFNFAHAAAYWGLTIEIWRNDVLCYGHPKYDDKTDCTTVNFNVKYKYKDCSPCSSDYNSISSDSRWHDSFEKAISMKSKKLVTSININRPSYNLEISSIECKYEFLFDCRILKTSINEKVCVVDGDKNLYFTHNIICKKK